MKYVPLEYIFKLFASPAASEFYEWVQVGIDVHISHRKYQVKPHSSSWSSGAYEVPVFKIVEGRCMAENYHPVSLTSAVSKVFEKLVR